MSNHGFQAAHRHAVDVVDYAAEECRTRATEPLDELRQVVAALAARLQEVVEEVEEWGDEVVAGTGADLAGSLDETREEVTSALSALDSVRDLLASYSFVAI